MRIDFVRFSNDTIYPTKGLADAADFQEFY